MVPNVLPSLVGLALTAPCSLIQVAFRETQSQDRQNHSNGTRQHDIVLKPWSVDIINPVVGWANNFCCLSQERFSTTWLPGMLCVCVFGMSVAWSSDKKFVAAFAGSFW